MGQAPSAVERMPVVLDSGAGGKKFYPKGYYATRNPVGNEA